jgi:hypothetical protein
MPKTKQPEVPKYDYLPVDRFVWYNTDDPQLFPIRVDQLWVLQRVFREYGLPEPKDFPEFKYVEGYGLPPSEQKFKREQIPDSLIQLEAKIKKSIKKDLSPLKKWNTEINLFWQELEDHPDLYKGLLDWINLMWFYRLFGKFLFINGRVTYMTGDCWLYQNHWTLKGNVRPEYRDRDRRWFLFGRFCELDTTTFKEVDPKTNKPIQNAEGWYDMIDLGYRICYGSNDLKHRQCGETSKVECSHTDYITRMIDKHAAIQGKDDENAENVFRWHCVYPFMHKNWPIYFRPLRDEAEKLNPKNTMYFHSDEVDFSLGSRVTFAKSADAVKYDNEKIDRYHCDEPGKTLGVDVGDRHDVMKPTMARGAGKKIDGAARYVTTVELIDDPKASANYMKLCYDSMFENRLPNGQTKSGMFTGFFRASDGLEEYIGPFGESIEYEPTPEQYAFTGNKMGARQYIEQTIKAYKRDKDWLKLASFKRKHPILFKDNFSIALKNTFFNKEALESRFDYLSFDARHLRAKTGNFHRMEYPDGDVVFIEEDDGRFRISIDMLDMAVKHGRLYKPNTRHRDMNGIWMPDTPTMFTASADPYSLNKTLGRSSNGGGAVRWRRDKRIDPLDKPIEQWESARPVCTYSAKPELLKGLPDSYCEDMLMMCQFFNVLMYPERNVNVIEEWFTERKYNGYLLYDLDPVTFKPKPNPGWWHGGADNKKAIEVFNHYKDEISMHAKRWVHDDLLLECLNIVDVKDMTNYDLFTAYGGTLLAELNPYYSILDNFDGNDTDVFSFMEQYEGG